MCKLGKESLVAIKDYVDNKLSEQSTQILSNIAPIYSPSSTYMSGDLAVYQGVLYRCMYDGTTGAWNALRWELTNIGELKQDMNVLQIIDESISMSNENDIEITHDQYVALLYSGIDIIRLITYVEEPTCYNFYKSDSYATADEAYFICIHPKPSQYGTQHSWCAYIWSSDDHYYLHVRPYDEFIPKTYRHLIKAHFTYNQIILDAYISIISKFSTPFTGIDSSKTLLGGGLMKDIISMEVISTGKYGLAGILHDTIDPQYRNPLDFNPILNLMVVGYNDMIDVSLSFESDTVTEL